YLQVTGGGSAGLALEFQDGSLDQHYRSKDPDLPLALVIDLFQRYARGDQSWRDEVEWVHVPYVPQRIPLHSTRMGYIIILPIVRALMWLWWGWLASLAAWLCAWLWCDPEPAGRLSLDLDRRVVDAESGGQDHVQVLEDAILRGIRGDDHVGAHRLASGREGPDVEIVDALDARRRAERRLDLTHVQMRRRPFEQHVHGRA